MDLSKLIYDIDHNQCKTPVIGEHYYFAHSLEELSSIIGTGSYMTFKSITKDGEFIPEEVEDIYPIIYPIDPEEHCEVEFKKFYDIWKKKPFTLFSLSNNSDCSYYEGLITMVDPNDYSFRFGDRSYEIDKLIDGVIELNVIE